MCNVYKNNLIVLSQIDYDQLLYLTEYTLNIDNRYLSIYRSGTNQKKICYTINKSFLSLINNYILNITNIESSLNKKPQDLSLSLEDNIEEIKNTKELLNNSLKGVKIYIDNLEKYNYERNLIEELYINLTKIYEKVDELRDNYITSIDNNNENTNSENWLYKLYQNTIRGNHKTQEEPQITEKQQTSEYNTINNEIENDEIEQEEDSNNECETSDSYVFGFLYIISRKISNLVLSVGNHIRYILMR